MKQQIIACLGSGHGESSDPLYQGMENVGRLLAERGYVVATGGFGGIGMEAPSRGARRAGGRVIGYTMRGIPVNEYVTEVFDTNHALPPERQYAQRLGRLLEADGFIAAACGGPGTGTEILAFINLGIKIWRQGEKRLAILEWDDWGQMFLHRLESLNMLTSASRELILVTATPEEAVGWVAPAS